MKATNAHTPAERPYVVLVEHCDHGHHPIYLRKIIAIYLGMGVDVLCVHPHTAELKQWVADRLGPDAAAALEVVAPQPRRKIAVRKRPYKVRMAVQSWLGWLALRRTLAERIRARGRSPEIVFFHKFVLDHVMYLPAWIARLTFPWPWAALFIWTGEKDFMAKLPLVKGQPGGHFPLNCRGLYTLDEFLPPQIAEITGVPAYEFPDFAARDLPPVEPPVVERLREFAAGRKIVGLYGFINKRKGLFPLITLSELALQKDLPVCFAFVGKIQEAEGSRFMAEIRAAIDAQPRPNCFFDHDPGIPEDADFNALIAATDLVYAAYVDYPYSSNIVAKAAALHRPLIVSEGHLMGRLVTEYRLGYTVPQEDPAACLAALEDFLAQGAPADPGYEAFYAQHSPQRLEHVLREMLHLPSRDT